MSNYFKEYLPPIEDVNAFSKEEFYAYVYNIVCPKKVDFIEPNPYVKRWGQRNPGNGRMPGYGIVRRFSPTLIHVAMSKPQVMTGTFTSQYDALEFFMSYMLTYILAEELQKELDKEFLKVINNVS